MISINSIAKQVEKNCDISDAKYCGFYSVCNLTMGLRNLYKWRKGIVPWLEDDHKKVAAWIEEKENLWEKLVNNDFEDIRIEKNIYSPFDIKEINFYLRPRGFLYGAGYARSLKPTFFLAEIEDHRFISGVSVYILNHEWIRDLFAAPGMLQENEIFVRKETLAYFLWDKINWIKSSGRRALKWALEQYGLPGDITDLGPEEKRKIVEKILPHEMDALIYHEMGEARDETFDREIWQEIVRSFNHTPVELLARGIKDVLADTTEKGRLKHIIDQKNKGSLGFYVAFLDGFSRLIFPEIVSEFEGFVLTERWKSIDAARKAAYINATRYVEKLIFLYHTGKDRGHDWLKAVVQKELIEPLTQK